MVPTLISLGEFLSNYTFRNMLLGTAMIGGFSGALGCFLYLRKQSLISDVIGHSAVAGVMVAFIFATALLGINGRSMLVLTIGGVCISVCSVLLANWITRHAKIGVDAAMAVCLAIFYGGGTVLMRQIVHSSLPNRGGIDKYLFGNAATLTYEDLTTILIFGSIAVGIMLLFWKEFKLLTFDPILAQTAGFNGRVLNPLLLGAVTVAIVIGLKAVGLILMIAFAVSPAAAARQWTRSLSGMVVVSALIGAGAGALGSYLAVNLGKVPTGPVIVIVLFLIFLFSILFSPQRSLVFTALAQSRHRQRLISPGASPVGRTERKENELSGKEIAA